MKQQVLKNGEAGKEPGTEAGGKGPPARYVDTVEETQGDIRSAYRAYSGAQKDLIVAFKEQQQQGKNAYRNTEKQYQFYEEIIDKAFRNRERAEQQALEAYRDTLKKAGETYREAVRQALIECKRTTDKAWNFAMETSRQRQTGWTYHCRAFIIRAGDRVKALAKTIKVRLAVWYRQARRIVGSVRISTGRNTRKEEIANTPVNTPDT